MEKVEEYEARIAALERKVGQLTMEVDILKKLRERTSPPEVTPSVISGPAVSPSSKDAKSRTSPGARPTKGARASLGRSGRNNVLSCELRSRKS